jgi:hypothetical protein
LRAESFFLPVLFPSFPDIAGNSKGFARRSFAIACNANFKKQEERSLKDEYVSVS